MGFRSHVAQPMLKLRIMYQFFILLAIVWGWGIWAGLALFSPHREKRMILPVVHRVSPNLWSAISFALAVLFWYASSVVVSHFLLQLFAVLLALKGVVILTLRREQFEKLLGWWFSLPARWSRAIGSVSLVIVIYLITHISISL